MFSSKFIQICKCEVAALISFCCVLVAYCADVQLAAVQEASLVRNRDEDGIPLLLL